MVAVNVKIIQELKCFLTLILSDSRIKEVCFEKKEDFSRKRKLGFEDTVLLILNILKRSLKVEIQDFLEYGLKYKISYTKMAFSLQRKKIKPLVFEVWNQLLVDCFYKYYGNNVKCWKDFLLIAVDGSTAYLFDKPEIKEHFGVQINQHKDVPMARILKFYDVLNNITIFSKIAPISKGELPILLEQIEKVPVNSISIYDRGFPSYTLMYMMNNQEQMRHFVIRAKLGFNKEVKEFVRSNKKDITLNLYPGKDAKMQLYGYGFSVLSTTAVRVRMVKVILDTGVTEVLLTNLYDCEKFETACFKELYFKRWGIEISFCSDKNIVRMEEFSGQSVKSIEQDFQITSFILNLQSLIEKQCEPLIEEITKDRTHKYKVNKNVSIGSMKHRLVRLFTTENPEKILIVLQDLFLESLEPIRPGRSAPRIFRNIKKRGKCATVNNYKRVV